MPLDYQNKQRSRRPDSSIFLFEELLISQSHSRLAPSKLLPAFRKSTFLKTVLIASLPLSSSSPPLTFSSYYYQGYCPSQFLVAPGRSLRGEPSTGGRPHSTSILWVVPVRINRFWRCCMQITDKLSISTFFGLFPSRRVLFDKYLRIRRFQVANAALDAAGRSGPGHLGPGRGIRLQESLSQHAGLLRQLDIGVVEINRFHKGADG